MTAYKSLLPPEAEAEIMERLSTKMRISSDEIAVILEKHGVSGDAETLQSAYRKRLGQRLMSSIRERGVNGNCWLPGASTLWWNAVMIPRS